MPYKVCFRGDSRTPEAIFNNGFKKRQPEFPNPQLRYSQTPHSAPDIDPPTAVCFAARLSAAALFPIQSTSHDYLYMLAMETEKIFNTHKEQVMFSLNKNAERVNALRAGPEAVMWPIFAQELAANEVPSGNIIAAVRFTKTYNRPNDPLGGGYYTLDTNIRINPNCTVPSEVKTPAMAFLLDEVQHHRTEPLPLPRSGFHASTAA